MPTTLDATGQAIRTQPNSWVVGALLPFVFTAGALAQFPWDLWTWRLSLAIALAAGGLRSALSAFRFRKSPIPISSYRAVVDNWVTGSLGGIIGLTIATDEKIALRYSITVCIAIILFVHLQLFPTVDE